MLEVNFDPFPVIITDRLVLRRTTPDDVDGLYLLRKNEDVMQYIDRPRPKDHSDILSLINLISNRVDSNEGIEWSITWREDGSYLGTISFHQIMKENYRAEVGYMLDTAWHRKGIMSEALQAVMKYGFETMKLHSVTAELDPRNVASAQLLLRHGFVQEGLLRDNHFWRGEFIDTAIYSIINGEGGV